MEITSGVQQGLLSLPSGGGGLKSLGERFQPDLLRGSGSYAIPIDLPKGPNNLRPTLGLRYATGNGNGIFGMGWQLNGPLFIMRRTEKGLPGYADDDEFVLAGSEVLVHVGDDRYRPRSDTQFWHIQRNADHWLIRTKDGRRYTLGATEESRIEHEGRVFGWMLDEEQDNAGNKIHYQYEREDNQLYLKQIDWSIYRVTLAYEERVDIIHDGRAGFPIHTRRRCSAIERYCPKLDQPLLARYQMTYVSTQGSGLSILSEVQLIGHGDDGEIENFPPMRFAYSQHRAENPRYLRLTAEDLPPPSLERSDTTLVDMNGDGLPDFLQTDRSGHHLWENKGEGHIGVPKHLDIAPVGMNLGEPGVTFSDLTGDGSADLVRIDNRFNTAVLNTGTGAWEEQPSIWRQQFPIAINSSAMRLVDLDGDGIVDLLQSGTGGFIQVYNTGQLSWQQPETIARNHNLDRFPDVALDSDGIEMLDMTGDGLTDVVHVQSGLVEYWPYLGYGRWDTRVDMINPPRLPRGFRRDRLFFSDLDGNGVSDILYVEHDIIYYWLNQSGNGWSDRFEIPFVPPPNVASVHMTDFLGKGTRGILWSGQARSGDDTGYRFLDLSEARKPYLLTEIDNGFGGTTTINFSTTTAMRSAAERKGSPWNTYLPFPLQVVSEIVERDHITQLETQTRFEYERGYYDPAERLFRGFEKVRVTHTGDEHTPTAVRETIFNLGSMAGPSLTPPNSARERAIDHCISGSIRELNVFEVQEGVPVLQQNALTEWEAREEFNDGDKYVFFPHLVRTVSRDIVPDEPERLDKAEYEFDLFGNAIRKERKTRFSNQIEAQAHHTIETLSYTNNESEWLVGLGAKITTRNGTGQLLSEARYFYDGEAFIGLAEGQATQGILRRSMALELADHATPIGYAENIQDGWGLQHLGEGYYRTVEAYNHDTQGNMIAQRDGLGIERQISYDNDHLFPLQVTEGDGTITRSTFDTRTAQPQEMMTSDSVKSKYVYSPLGRLTAQFDTADDGTLQLTQYYSVFYRDALSTPSEPAAIVSVKPQHAGQTLESLISAPDLTLLPDLDIQFTYYDAKGNLIQRSRRGSNNADDKAWIIGSLRTYARNGEPAHDYPNRHASSPAYQVLADESESTSFVYETSGQATLIKHADGGRFRVRYLLNRVEKWDANMDDTDPPMVEFYNALGHLTGISHPDGQGNRVNTEYDIDHAGRITRIQDASGNESASYTYAGPGSAIHIRHIESGERTYWRDANGQLRLRTDHLGRHLTLDYDRYGRMTTATDLSDPAQPNVVRQLTYNGRHLTRIDEDGAVVNFTLDRLGRQLTKTVEFGDDQPLVMSYEYGLQGEVTALIYPDGTRVEQSYHLNGMISGLSGFVNEAEYDAHDNPLTIQFDGSAQIDFGYTPVMNRLDRLTLAKPGDVLRDVRYEYDLNGQIVGVTDHLDGSSMHRRYHYDGLYRLTRADTHQGDLSGPVTSQQHYEYSNTGDLQRNDESGLRQMRYADAAHPGRLTEVESGTGDRMNLDYDAGGRLINFAQMSNLKYDIWDRLIEATLVGGERVRFQYDSNNLRIRKQLIHSGGEVVEQRCFENLYEAGAEETRINVYLGRLLVATQTTKSGVSEKEFILTDHLGSLLSTCDSAATLLHQQLYTPYGVSVQAGGQNNRYHGLASDIELGMIHMGSRYYHPMLGRFITPDWYVIENPTRNQRLPQGYNVYCYAINNPIMLRDASGLWFGIDDLIVAAVGFVVGFVVGIVVGIAQGKSFGDTLLLGLEGGLLGAAGAWLAWNTAGLALGALSAVGLGVSGGVATGIMVGAAVIGGLNGIISGVSQIYDWSSPSGWLAFLSDSSWGLIGTTLGVLVHGVNLFYGDDRRYNSSLSKRQNRHVYDGGFGFGNFAFTQGNVISNLEGRHGSLLDHESVHILQNRLFGPIFQGVYVVWLVGGTIIGFLIGIFTNQSLGQDIMDVAYLNNPWETWAYSVGGTPDSGDLSWT